MQHVLDYINGLPSGDVAGNKNYWRLAGEVQPRNAEARLDLPKVIRELFRPEVTEDVARIDQVIQYLDSPKTTKQKRKKKYRR